MGKAVKQAKEIAAEATEQTTEQLATAAGTEEPTAEPVQQEEQPQAPAVSLDELEGMDMEYFAGSFNEGEAKEGHRGPWRIADDGCEDWAVRKIAEEKAELDRITALGEAQIEAINQKIEAAQRRYENGTRFLTAKLAEYFETVPHKTTKTQHSYRLLSGSLVKKLGGVTMKQDDSKLLEYLKASGNTDMIQTTEKPKWGEFKKRLQILGGSVVDGETGEIVEAVQVIEQPDTFSVKL